MENLILCSMDRFVMITLGFGSRYADDDRVAICVSQPLVITPKHKPSGNLLLIENRRTGFDIWLLRLLRHGSRFSRTMDGASSRINHAHENGANIQIVFIP